MSNINAASGSHYISNAKFLEWMQTKTDGLYAKMSDAMDVSNDRADAEDALNNIKGKIADLQAGKADANDVYAAIHDATLKFGSEFPEVKDMLTPIAKELADKGAKLPGIITAPPQYIPPRPEETIPDRESGDKPNPEYTAWQNAWGKLAELHPDWVGKKPPGPITLDADTANRWQDKIKNTVEALSKQDQLGLINLQEYNAQLNQAKQTASALMDAADKAASGIISHIS